MLNKTSSAGIGKMKRHITELPSNGKAGQFLTIPPNLYNNSYIRIIWSYFYCSFSFLCSSFPLYVRVKRRKFVAHFCASGFLLLLMSLSDI